MQTPDLDRTAAATHADVHRLVEFLYQQLDTEVEDRQNDVRYKVCTAIEVALNILREDFDQVVNCSFSRRLKNGKILAQTTETMERAAESHQYLRNLATALWKTNGVSEMVSTTVRPDALHAVETEQGTQQSCLEALFDAR